MGQTERKEWSTRSASFFHCRVRHPCVLCKGGIPRCSTPWAFDLLRSTDERRASDAERRIFGKDLLHSRTRARSRRREAPKESKSQRIEVRGIPPLRIQNRARMGHPAESLPRG